MNKRILIVEDEKNIVDILSFNLSKEGYETLEAYDGEAGLQLALEQNPDLILLDLMLPKMNGFDVCRSLRRENRSTPVIMLTAREEETDKVLGLELGADDYITKPFSMRELLARGEGWEYLSPAVYGYILRHGLYGAGRDLKRLPDRELRACSYSMIRAKRIAHVKGTEEEAVRLARRWGADEEHARRAAILHDCTKYLELDEQLQLCAKYGIVLDELEQQAVKLLHSKTGACVARHVYGVSDDIYEAIFWHTTGKADMTLLEKLLYIADYMEPTRDFPGVERLRALAYEDLDAAVLLGCEMSIQEMAERGLPVHPNTVKARDWLRSKTKGTSD